MAGTLTTRWALALAGALALAACGGGETPVAGVTAPVRLRLQAFGDPAELGAYQQLITAFEAATPDVRVEFNPVGNQPDHMTRLTSGFAGGNPPDLFLINFRRYGQFAAKGVLEPLGPALTARGAYREADFYAPALDAFRYQGTLMCAPQNISSLVVYYNTRAFQEAGLPPPTAGWTWDDFLRAARALTRDTDGDGQPDVYGLGFEPTLVRLAPFVWQAGGDIVDNLDAPTRFTLDTPAAREAQAFVRALYATHQVTPPLLQNKSEDHESRFARGGLGMILHSRRYTATLRTVKALAWDVAPLPAYKQAATVLHADAYCMAKVSPHKDAAYRFVEFALSPAGAGIIARSGRTVPALQAVAQGPDFLDPTQSPKSAQVFLDTIAHIRRMPSIASWNDIEMRVDPLVEEWYFSAMPPGKPLHLDLSDGTSGLFGASQP